MQNGNLIASCLAGLFLSSLTSAFAADQEQTKNQAQDQVQQQIKTQDQTGLVSRSKTAIGIGSRFMGVS